jgi:hypothetical protein
MDYKFKNFEWSESNNIWLDEGNKGFGCFEK